MIPNSLRPKKFKFYKASNSKLSELSKKKLDVMLKCASMSVTLS